MQLPRPPNGWKQFFLQLKDAYLQDQVGNLAGAVTFFAILALFPFLLFTVALASVVIDVERAEALIVQLSQVSPGPATEILSAQLRNLGKQNNVGLLTLGAAGALFSASGGVVALMSALNVVHGVEETRSWWRVRGLAFLVTIGTAVLGVLAGLIAVVTPSLLPFIDGMLAQVLVWLRLPLAGVLVALLWGALYSVLPSKHLPLRFFTPGAIVGVLLWLVLSWGFSFYVSRFGSYDATYGALGGVIVLLLWIWLSTQALLMGAEIDMVLADSHKQHPPRPVHPPSRPRWAELGLGLWMANLLRKRRA